MKIEIFRAGTHTSNSGEQITFTPDMLKDAAQAYDPSVHEAPIVIGHPKDGAPAYGWVKAIEYDESNQKVYAELDQVDEGFKQLHNDGRYKKRSASWYAPNSPSNPKPGSLYIRHLGFLGAQPPALKGMPNISFAEGEEATFEFGEKTMFETLKTWITNKFGAEEAALAFGEQPATEAPVEAPAEPVAEASTETPAAEAGTDAPVVEPVVEPANEPETVAEVQDPVADRLKEIEKREAALQATEIASFCEGLITEGKMLPAEKAKVQAVFSLLYKQSEQFDFSEDGSGNTTTAAQALKDIFANRPKLVDFSELAAEAPVVEPPKADFVVANGFSVDPAQLVVLAKAQAYMKANSCDLQTALKHTI